MGMITAHVLSTARYHLAFMSDQGRGGNFYGLGKSSFKGPLYDF